MQHFSDVDPADRWSSPEAEHVARPARRLTRRLFAAGGLSACFAAAMASGDSGWIAAAKAGRPVSPNATIRQPPSVMPLQDHPDWAAFKRRFVTGNGRVVDTGNGSVSHTEGQGLGMLFAVAFGDRQTFDNIHAWTTEQLQRPDGLHAWRWIAGQERHVADPNNATDGDITIAAALQRAAGRWQCQAYADAARVIARAIVKNCLVDVCGRTVLLPGAAGFTTPERVVVNLSYYVFPLFDDLNAAWPSTRWTQLQRDGLDLLRQARFGRWRLPPDWLEVNRVDGSLCLAGAFPGRFSYDAIRVPLFLQWSGLAPEVVGSVASFWKGACARQPFWADLKTDVAMGGFGLRGANSVAGFIMEGKCQSGVVQAGAAIPGDTYYSAALHLLTRMAISEQAS